MTEEEAKIILKDKIRMKNFLREMDERDARSRRDSISLWVMSILLCVVILVTLWSM